MDKLIEGLAGIAAVLFLLALAVWAGIYVIVLAILLFVCAAPSTLLGVVTAQISLFRDRHRLLSGDGPASALGKFVNLHLCDDHLAYEIDEAELARCMKGTISHPWAAVLGLLAGAIPALGLYGSGGFSLGRGSGGIEFSWAPPELFLVSSLLLSGGIVLVTTLGHEPAKAIRSALDKRLRKLVDHVNAAFTQGWASLYALEAEVAGLADRLKVDFPTDYAEEIREVLARNDEDMLSGPSPLGAVIDRARVRARQDRADLERVVQTHDSALSAVADAKAALASASAPQLRRKLDDRYQVLVSPDLKSLVSGRQWQDYYEIVAGMVADLERIRQEALDLASRDDKADDRCKPEAGPMTPDRAYSILGVPSTATDSGQADVPRARTPLASRRRDGERRYPNQDDQLGLRAPQGIQGHGVRVRTECRRSGT